MQQKLFDAISVDKMPKKQLIVGFTSFKLNWCFIINGLQQLVSQARLTHTACLEQSSKMCFIDLGWQKMWW